MKFLILSDVHGNKFGLQAVLECEFAYDKILCLGDVVGYGAHPNECCEILRERGALSLSGNHDAAALGKIDIEWFNPIAKSAILWTREQLNPQNRAWLESLPAHQVFGEWGFEAVHASLREPWEEYIVDAVSALPTFALMTQPLCFCGHTHVAMLAAVNENPQEWHGPRSVQWVELPQGAEIELVQGEKTLINPGSCGQPRDGNSQAKAAIFDTEARTVQVFTVEYGVEAARDAILEAGLPARLGDRLLTGN